MISIKIIVLFVCIYCLYGQQIDYCKLCTNHTMCQYKIPGPSTTCNQYDYTALLTNKEIQELVREINERRNFIAVGHSNTFRPASNMKKVHWSNELASFAQRWADQCDPFDRPNREDTCRDLETLEVGQTIGSVAGGSASINVKSFIEMWFMQIFDYSGTVTNYIQSRDHHTKYFTQLIWAETEFVGCGKVKFNVRESNKEIVRLVCNFAPKGNINGRPIYSIGEAGTQCTNNMGPDKEYQGLCDYERVYFQNVNELSDVKGNISRDVYPANIIMKDVSNYSIKPTIDPLCNSLLERNAKKLRQRNQKPRHVTFNNNDGTLKNLPLRKMNTRTHLPNLSRNLRNDFQLRDQGHSRVYHGYVEPQPIPQFITPYFHGNIMPRIENYEYVTPPIYKILSTNYHSSYQECTRKVAKECCNNPQCTRGQHHCCQRHSGCQREAFSNPTLPNTLCPQISMCPSICCSTVCPSLFTTVFNMDCSCLRNALKCNKNIPNLIRNGEQKSTYYNDISTMNEEANPSYDSNLSHIHKTENEIFEKEKLSRVFGYETNKEQARDYFYRSVNSGLRGKRDVLYESLRPFWQIQKNQNYYTPEIKSMKYTTLPYRKIINPRRNLHSTFKHISTELITIKRRDYLNENKSDDEEESTDKELSFDKLVYLRKLSENYQDYYPMRRNNKQMTETNKATPLTNPNESLENSKNSISDTPQTNKSTPLTNTETIITKSKKRKRKGHLRDDTKNETTIAVKLVPPFSKLTKCTRKLTCTWTPVMGIDGGGVNPEIGVVNIGSRTPPGFIENCSRTSTCTRPYMNRNTNTAKATGSDTEEDEEYCEKRDLKVYRRDSDYNMDAPSISHTHNLTDRVNFRSYIVANHSSVCAKKIRKKRQTILTSKDVSKVISYADLYYLVLDKIVKRHDAVTCKFNECSCNRTTYNHKVPFYSLCFLFCFFRYFEWFK